MWLTMLKKESSEYLWNHRYSAKWSPYSSFLIPPRDSLLFNARHDDSMLKYKKISLLTSPQNFLSISVCKKKCSCVRPWVVTFFSKIPPPPNFLFIFSCMHLNNTWKFVFYAQISIKIFNYMLYIHTLVEGYCIRSSFSYLWYS